MKKKAAAVIWSVCILLCGMAGCEREAPVETTVPEAVTTQTEVPEPTEAHSVYMDEETVRDVQLYGSVLETYRQALTEKWNMEQYAEAGISYLATYCDGGDPKQNVCFGFHDLDRDGDRELLIGAAVNDEPVDKQTFEAYDLVDGEPRQLFCGFERIRYYLCDVDGVFWIARESSGGAAQSDWLYMVYHGQELEVMQGIAFDADATPETPWYAVHDIDYDVTGAESLDEKTAKSVIASFEERKISMHRGFACQYTFDKLN